MKKFFYLFLASFAMTFMFVSCDETVQNDENENQFSSTIPVTPEEQKKRLEEVGVNLANELSASNFEDVSKLATELAEKYSEYNYDYSEIEKWADDCYNAITASFIGTEYYMSDYYTYAYNNYEVLFAASNFTGKFEAKNGKWKYTEANDLSFHVTDNDGNPCVFKLATSGKSKEVFVGEEYYETTWDEDTLFYDCALMYLSIPEKLTVSFEQNDKAVSKVTVETDLSMADREVNLRKDKYNVSVKCEVNNYSVNLDKIKYAPEKGSEVVASIKKGSNSLVKVSLSSDLDISNNDFYGAENSILNIDITGNVQIKGSIKGDIVELIKQYEETFDREYTNEKEFKQNVEKLNQMIDLKLYYNNSKKESAVIKLIPMVVEDYYDYYLVAVVSIVFDDETSYSVEEFFNEQDFRNLIKAFKRLAEDYYDLFDIYY